MKKRLLLLTALLAVILSTGHFFFGLSRDGFATGPADRALVYLYKPFVAFLGNAHSFFSALFHNYLVLVDVHSENHVLKNELQFLKIENQSLRQQLKDKMGIDQVSKSYSHPARRIQRVAILNHDPFLLSRTLMISAGKRDGIKLNTVVVSDRGLVGRVVQAFDDASKVLLMIDGAFSVDVYNERTDMRCLVSGLQMGDLTVKRLPYLSQIEYVEKGHELKAGDVLLTSGLGGIYPRGIPVGVVLKVNLDKDGFFEESPVMPAVDFTKVNDLYVLIDP
ncbi:MAG: rod shape-determining protein MreC [Deltaproteobacteria bacterium]|nr:rod shape-determining protein MreC [Deltaproteobacteria bacterium]